MQSIAAVNFFIFFFFSFCFFETKTAATSKEIAAAVFSRTSQFATQEKPCEKILSRLVSQIYLSYAKKHVRKSIKAGLLARVI